MSNGYGSLYTGSENYNPNTDTTYKQTLSTLEHPSKSNVFRMPAPRPPISISNNLLLK